MFAMADGANTVNPQFAGRRDVMLEIEWDKEVKAVSVTAEGPVFPRG